MLTAVPLPAGLRALTDGLAARVVDVHGCGDKGTLAAWLRGGRADAVPPRPDRAVPPRPDRAVLDAVPAGGADFTDTAAWAPLLRTPRGCTQSLASPLPRGTAR